MAIEITPERVRATAELARLALRDDELAPLTAQLQKILGYIAELDALDTGDAPAMRHASATTSPMRDDEPRAGVPRDEALAQAPKSEGGAFVVPQFVDE